MRVLVSWAQDSRVSDSVLEGIYMVSTLGGAIWDNIVTASHLNCIRHPAGMNPVSVRENHVGRCGGQAPYVGDGIKIEGADCSVERNHVSCNVDWGPHFTSTASGDTSGGNTAIGNFGTPSCTGTTFGGVDFCDEGTGTARFGNNLVPTLQ